MQLSSLPSPVGLDTLTWRVAPQSKATAPVFDGQVIETSDAQSKGSVQPPVKKEGKGWEKMGAPAGDLDGLMNPWPLTSSIA